MRARQIIPYSLVSFVIVLSDQIAKILILQNLHENEAISIIGNFLYFRFIYNQGGAWGTSIGPSWVYTILSIVALVLIVKYFIGAKSAGKIDKISLAIIFGGAVGNLIDRIIYGKVVDFIDMDIPDIPFLNLYRWFTFNIADAAITIGLVIFAFSLFLNKEDKIENIEDSSGIPSGEIKSDSSQA